MQDYQTIGQQLIDAVTNATNAKVAKLDVDKGNTFAQINNTANANGTLYSTKPAFQKDNYVANTYEPAVAEAKMAPLTTKLSVVAQATNILNAVDAQNRAAAMLNKIQFDY